MTREEIEYFKFMRKILCEDHLKICPKDSVAYRATLKEKEFYDMAIKALEQEPKTGHWIDKEEKIAVCSCCNRNNLLYGDFCKWCGAKMIESEDKE